MRLTLLFAALLLPLAAAEDKKKPTDPPPLPHPVTREGSVTIQGEEIAYEVTTAKLRLKNDKGEPRAEVFHVSYLRSDIEDSSDRPVIFAFNGGPGSSAVWLHLGMLGPHRVEMPGDGTAAPEPPARLVPNEHSLLDLADLVFIDPVSTGYSRPLGDTKKGEFHGLNEDIESVGDFIRRWVTEHERWASPKFLLGESYGGIRAAGLADHLQSRYGMSLNGVVLLSALLDFRTLQESPGDHLLFSVFLPTYTRVAQFHGQLDGGAKLVEEARAFAFDDYALALIAGNALPAERKSQVARELERFTAIDADLIERLDLRLDPSRFRAELLREDGKLVGRFDGRVTGPAADETRDYPDHDPSYSVVYGAYSTAMLGYLGDELGWKEDSPYEILTGDVRPWNWGSSNRIVNVGDHLRSALRDNAHLQVLVMKGACDLATPPENMEYSLRHLEGAADAALERIEHVDYDSGHMFYLNPPDLEKSSRDLRRFLEKAR